MVEVLGHLRQSRYVSVTVTTVAALATSINASGSEPLATTLTLALVVCLLSGCGFFYDERLAGPYRLLAVDNSEEMAICEAASSGGCGWVVPPTVFAVGWNTSFIIAKQHPLKPRASKPDKSTTTFWIIRVADRTVIGPLSEPDFELTRIKLGVPSELEFKKHFPDLAEVRPNYIRADAISAPLALTRPAQHYVREQR
jgi:hypothetical protein